MNSPNDNSLPPLPGLAGTLDTKPADTSPKENLTINQKENMNRTNQPVSAEESDAALPPISKKKEKKQEEKVIERVIIKEKNGRRLSIGGCGCRTISCLGCLVFLAIIVGVVAIVWTKPTNIWGKTVSFLNADVSTPQYDYTTYESAVSSVNNQIEQVGHNQIIINDQELTALGRQSIPQLKNLIVDVEDEKMTLYWDLDTTDPNKPLVGLLEFKRDANQSLYITNFGTKRVGTPMFVNKYLTDLLFSLLNLGSSDKSNHAFLTKLISLNRNVAIDNIEFDKDQLKLDVTVNVSIFSSD